MHQCDDVHYAFKCLRQKYTECPGKNSASKTCKIALKNIHVEDRKDISSILNLSKIFVCIVAESIVQIFETKRDRHTYVFHRETFRLLETGGKSREISFIHHNRFENLISPV